MKTTIINDGILELAKNVAGEKNNLHSHAAYREFRERFRYPGEVLETFFLRMSTRNFQRSNTWKRKIPMFTFPAPRTENNIWILLVETAK